MLVQQFDVVQMEEVIEDISQKDGDAHEYSDDQFEVSGCTFHSTSFICTKHSASGLNFVFHLA